MSRHSLRADESDMINRYSDMVYRMAYSLLRNQYDAEDVHQEVFIRYLKKPPDFESAGHEKAWFLRVTVNLCKNLRKTAWVRRVTGLGERDFAEEAADGGGSREEQDEVIGIVKQLPQKYRIVIHLYYYEEMSTEEIAGALKLKPSTVRTQLVRAREKLKELYAGR